MRLLIDENLSPRLAEELRSRGYAARHVRAVGLDATVDERIAVWAAKGRWTVVTQDHDFLDNLRVQGAQAPSVIEIVQRDGPGVEGLVGAQHQAMRLAALLPAVKDRLQLGAAVVVGRHTHRVERLPLDRTWRREAPGAGREPPALTRR